MDIVARQIQTVTLVGVKVMYVFWVLVIGLILLHFAQAYAVNMQL